MLMCTTWKNRPLSQEQTTRMMDIWGKVEADVAERPGMNRLCWFAFGDGSGGFSVSEVANDDDAAFLFEVVGALSEFLEFEVKPVVDLESVMPLTAAIMERTGAV